ncbi:MAG: hypothetical protein CVU11_14245 [Bacteroidetes bacterium HGW-Bacteroidetes-6]|jgi:hypothetical protein|nr:MAG: hypothetical protein CVU11_14245 [Bacteroidetes bacterium HGW-Bacteroidetes-6]
MKKVLLFCFIVLGFSAARSQSVNGVILADTGNITVVQVYGNHYQRGFAYGYLCSDKIMSMWNNYIQPNYGAYLSLARAIVGNPSYFSVDSQYVTEARGIIDGVSYAGYDTTGLSYLDLFVVNFMTDLEGFLSKSGFPESQNCSSLMNWGAATQGTDLNGKSVIAHFLDAISLDTAITQNQVIVVHFPSEPDEQPWLMTGVAGQMVASQAMNQDGVVVFLNTVNGFSAQLNKGYEPMTLTLRKSVEKADFNGDGLHNVSDVRAAINVNTNGYASGFIVSAIAPSTAGADSLISVIIECAPDVPYITFRTIADVDSLDGVNLYAANDMIKRNNAYDYCSRYINVKDTINHFYHGVGIGSFDNWEIMRTQSKQSPNLQFIQVIPETGLFTIAVADHTTPAWARTPVVFNLSELFVYTGINYYSNNSSTLSVFPNPATNQIGINSSEIVSGSLYRIVDLTGKTILSGKLNTEKTIDISLLNSGCFILEVVTENQVFSQKILK